VRFSAGDHAITVRGRDRVADLIDCAPDVSPGSWMNVTIEELARILAGPFGIEVRAEAPVGSRFDLVALNPGQRAFELLEERCRYRELLPISDGLGALVLARAGTAVSPVALVEGENILAGVASFSHTDRFQVYTVKGQSPGGDLVKEEISISPVARARDAAILRHRPMLVVPSSAVDLERCQRRARWEAIVRAARGDRAEITVQGWTQPGGVLWPLNAKVRVESPTLGVDGELLIAGARYSLDEQGSRTELELVRPDAFTAQPDEEVPEHSFFGEDDDE
jgi:prophage tail gpP-like protein